MPTSVIGWAEALALSNHPLDPRAELSVIWDLSKESERDGRDRDEETPDTAA
jgi:hypothetical protein